MSETITIKLTDLFDFVAQDLYANMCQMAHKYIDTVSRSLYDALPHENQKSIFEDFQASEFKNFQIYLSIRYLAKQLNFELSDSERNQ